MFNKVTKQAFVTEGGTRSQGVIAVAVYRGHDLIHGRITSILAIDAITLPIRPTLSSSIQLLAERQPPPPGFAFYF